MPVTQGPWPRYSGTCTAESSQLQPEGMGSIMESQHSQRLAAAAVSPPMEQQAQLRKTGALTLLSQMSQTCLLGPYEQHVCLRPTRQARALMQGLHACTHNADVVSGVVAQGVDEVVAVGIELLGPRVQREGVAPVAEELQPGSTRSSACCTVGSILLDAPCMTESEASLWDTVSKLPRPQATWKAQHCPMLQHHGGAARAPCRGCSVQPRLHEGGFVEDVLGR